MKNYKKVKTRIVEKTLSNGYKIYIPQYKLEIPFLKKLLYYPIVCIAVLFYPFFKNKKERKAYLKNLSLWCDITYSKNVDFLSLEEFNFIKDMEKTLPDYLVGEGCRFGPGCTMFKFLPSLKLAETVIEEYKLRRLDKTIKNEEKKKKDKVKTLSKKIYK
jgi:hypothetical protein